MYSTQLTMMSHMFTMKKRQIAVLLGEDSAPCTDNQKTSLVQTWNNFVSSNLSLPRLFGEPLSVTVVNDEILNSVFLENLSRKKDLSYVSQKARPLHLKENSPDYMKSILGLTPKNQDWLIVDESELINIRNDLNLLKNLIDTHEENSTMKSVPCFKETEKIMEDTTICPDPLDVDPRNQEADIHKDTDVESFLVVSHSDVPAVPVGLTTENSMSRISNFCRSAWNSLTCSLYCKPARMSVKHPLCLTKPHHYRKVNVIAVSRGRGRAKCQLRRSGVSQTLCRKECIKSNDGENNLVDVTSNDCIELDDKPDSLESNMDTMDSTRIAERIDSPVISHSSNATPVKEKAKAHRKRKIKAKDITKICYIPNSYRMSDYCEDSNDEMLNAQEDSFRSRTLSENPDDDWIVFEDEDEDDGDDDDDDELPEIRVKQGAIEYLTNGSCYAPKFSMRVNDITCKNSNSRTHYTDPASSRRLLSDGSNDSEDFNTSDNSDTLNSSFTSEENDDVVGCNEISFQDGGSQLEDDSIVFTNEDCEKLTAQTKKMPDAQKDSFRLRTLSKNSSDDWIVFEDDDDDELPEIRVKQGAIEYPTYKSCYAPDSSMRMNDTTYKNFIETHDDELLSSRRLLSDGSNDSEDFNMFDSSDALNSSFKSEENDDVDGCDEISFHDGGSQLEDDSIVFTDEDCEELTAQTKKVSFDPTPVVHVMVTWNYAYRAARRGPWEQYARDNERFRGRINSIAIVLDPVLRSKHRSQVWQKRFAFLE